MSALPRCFLAASLLLTSCAYNSVKFQPRLELSMEPVEKVVPIDGSEGRAVEFAQKAQLPHVTPRERFKAEMDSLHEFTAQIGSDDYELVGVVGGDGNAHSSASGLRKKICQRVGKEGGHVVLFVDSGVKEQHYRLVFPGRSTTQVQAQANTNYRATAYGTQNYATGYGTANTTGSATATTTYTPSQVVSGTNYLPWASGLVLRYVPGIAAYRQAVLALDDETLEAFLEEADRIWQDPTLSIDEAHALRCRLLQEYQGIKEGDERATPFRGANSGTGRRTQTFEEWAASRG